VFDHEQCGDCSDSLSGLAVVCSFNQRLPVSLPSIVRYFGVGGENDSSLVTEQFLKHREVERGSKAFYTYRLIILRIIGIAYCLVFPR